MAQERVQVETAPAPGVAAGVPGAANVSSPPPAPQPERSEAGAARARLHELAMELIRTQNRRLLIEFLQLRRQTA